MHHLKKKIFCQVRLDPLTGEQRQVLAPVLALFWPLQWSMAWLNQSSWWVLLWLVQPELDLLWVPFDEDLLVPWAYSFQQVSKRVPQHELEQLSASSLEFNPSSYPHSWQLISSQPPLYQMLRPAWWSYRSKFDRRPKTQRISTSILPETHWIMMSSAKILELHLQL